jgi:hypothetical protein
VLIDKEKDMIHTISSTLRYRPLASSSTDSDSVDDKPLLGFVSEAFGFVWTRGSRGSMDDC